MPAEENKALVRRYYEDLWNGRALALADTLFAPDFRLFPDSPPGPEGVKAFVTWLLGVFPDLTLRVDALLAAEEDAVVARFAVIGTQQGEFLGLRPTSKTMTIPEITIWRIADGVLAERWTVADVLEEVEQIGGRVVPSLTDG